MFRHEHKSGQLDPCLLARRVNGPGQLLSPEIIREQRKSLVTRKCELVEITGLVVVLDELTM